MGQLSKAIKAYLTALEIRPNFVTAYKNLGAAYDELGQFVDALKVYAKAIILAPHDAELRNDLGNVYFNIGSYAEAIKAFKQALDIDSDNAWAHYCLGLVYLDLRDIQLAWAQHDELICRDEKLLAFQLLDKIQLQSRQAS
jgi:superkiller protein 3